MAEKSILMADDDADDRFLVQAAFEDNNFLNKLVFFEDGEKLLTYLNHGTESISVPDLIFLDLNMPKSDGKEVLNTIRKNHFWNDVVVIILSTSNSPEEITNAYRLGANCYITKPSSYEALKITINRIHNFWLAAPGLL